LAQAQFVSGYAMGVVAELAKTFAIASAVLSDETRGKVFRLVEIVKEFLAYLVVQFIKASDDRPLLCHYESDSTPVLGRHYARYVLDNTFSIRRSGKADPGLAIRRYDNNSGCACTLVLEGNDKRENICMCEGSSTCANERLVACANERCANERGANERGANERRLACANERCANERGANERCANERRRAGANERCAIEHCAKESRCDSFG
jgi:hypothetical protein